MMKFGVVVQLLHLFLAVKACTEIRVTAKDKTVVVGRTMEFMVDLMSNVVVEPKGHLHTTLLPDMCPQTSPALTWKNKYKFAYLDTWNLSITSDGQNDAGLSVGALLFPGFAKYQDIPIEKCGSAISNLDFALWILGSFATVQEMREALKKDSFPLVGKRLLQDNNFELHFSIADKSGDGIIIEFTAEKGRTVYDNTIGVMTNSPPYDFHMLNLRNYVEISKYNHDPLVLGTDTFSPTGQGSGLLGVPGDFTPTSRLVRSAALVHFADPVDSSAKAVNLAFHIINSVDIPRGVASSRDHEGMADYTSWVVAKDITNNAIYFHSYEDLTIRVVHLDKVTSSKKLKVKVGGPVGGFVDVTGKLEPFAARTEL